MELSSKNNVLKNIGKNRASRNKHAIFCPACEVETIVVDLRSDAEYECAHCGFAFLTEVELQPFSTRLFDLSPLTTFH